MGQSDTEFRRPLGTCLVRALFWPFGFTSLALLLFAVLASMPLWERILLFAAFAGVVSFGFFLERRTMVSFRNGSIVIGNAYSSRVVRASEIRALFCGRISNGQLGPTLPGLAVLLVDGSSVAIQCSLGNSRNNRRLIWNAASAWARQNHRTFSAPELGPLATWRPSRG